MRRRSPHSQHRRARWTPLEISLLTAALLLMFASVSIEAYSWLNPPSAPAAPRRQEAATATATAPSETASMPLSETALAPTLGATEAPTNVLPSATVVLLTEQPITIAATTPLTATTTPTATTLPTATTPPTWTPLPTFEITDPPLTVDVAASTSAVDAGEQFTYFLTVSSSSEQPRQIELRASIDSRLDILEASSKGGACSVGYPTVCAVTATKLTPAEIIINLRVPVTMAAGSVLAIQALARDDLRVTAASERVEITVAGTKPQIEQVSPTRQPVAPVADDPAPAATLAPTIEPVLPASTTPAVVAAGLTVIPTATQTAVANATATASPGATTVPIATAAPVESPVTVLPPTLAPLAPTGNQNTPPTTPSVQLPRTAATVPTFGLGIGLLGVALTLHGTRRVRRAAARLSSAGAAFRRLTPLIDQSSDLQQTTIEEIEQMREDSAAMTRLLDEASGK